MAYGEGDAITYLPPYLGLALIVSDATLALGLMVRYLIAGFRDQVPAAALGLG